jgi:FixJ family two-component response regulator
VVSADPLARVIAEDGVTLVSTLNDIREEMFALKQGVDAGLVAPTMIVSRLSDVIERTNTVISELSRLPDMSEAEQRGVRKQAAMALLDVLTPRERQVANAVLQHGTTARAAYALSMSEATLGHHRSNILRKLKVASFAQIAPLFALGAR